MPSNNNIIKQFIDNVFAKKRHCNKGAFRQIPTAPNVHVYLVVVSIYAIGNSVPRDDIPHKTSHPNLFLNTQNFAHFVTKFQIRIKKSITKQQTLLVDVRSC